MSETDYLILQSAQQDNILPITSVCNAGCVFCSHKQNPPGIKVYDIGHRTLAEIEQTLDYIDADKKIVIGESVTKIIEGDPFCHPQIIEIFKLIRHKMPGTLIQLTTNGWALNQQIISAMAKLKPIELCLSVNAISDHNRRKIMKIHFPAVDIVNTFKLLNENKIDFHGSIVALPDITGEQEIEDTIAALYANGAKTVRVLMPGYTKYTADSALFKQDWEKTAELLNSLSKRYSLPIIIEPPVINNLEARIEGIIQGSLAEKAGLYKGDIIEKINEQPVFSRVDAFNKIQRAEKCRLEIARGNKKFLIVIDKEKGNNCGVVMAYDIEPLLINDIAAKARQNYPKTVLVLSSELGFKVLQYGLEKMLDNLINCRIISVPNRFFGGNIKAAGLLVMEDFIYAARRFFAENDEKPQALILPQIAFDYKGRDLTGHSYLEMEEVFDVKTYLL